jgi:hypothetical protein
MPGGPDRRLIFLNPTGPYRHLGLALKSLVQTGRDSEAPFKTVRSRASSKPDWPDYWEPWPGDPPSQGSLFRSHVFAVLFPAHRCRCSPFPCSSAHGRGWEELGSARGDSELADRYHDPATVGRSISGHQLSLAPRPGLGADRRMR